MTNPEAHFDWHNLTWDLRAQVSKNFVIVTPYAGLGASVGWTTIDYGLSGSTTIAGGSISDAQAFLKQHGLDELSIDNKGIGAEINNVDFGMRVFGGLSLNIMVVKLDLTGMFNFTDQSLGASLGLRFQL
jgi:hypothetical protein